MEGNIPMKVLEFPICAHGDHNMSFRDLERVCGVKPQREVPHLLYLGSPYSKYRGGHIAAARDVSKVAAWLMGLGFVVHSPIAHSHAVCEGAPLDRMDDAFWERQNKFLLQRATALVVAMLPGWEQSKGLSHEIDQFEKARKPIVYVSLSDLDQTS